MKQAAIGPLLLVIAVTASAQTRLQLGDSIEGNTAQPTISRYVLELEVGDLATVVVVQRGDANLAPVAVVEPGGHVLRTFAVPVNGRRQFSFVAERTGEYQIQIHAPAPSSSGRFDLTVIERLPVDERLRVRPRPERHSSPRLRDLRTNLAAGGTTDSFWGSIRPEGTPMIESSPVSDRYRLVTFLWRGDSTTRNVLVLGSFPPLPLADRQMTQLGESDVWYLTMQLPSDSRFFYTLSVNDPLAPFGPLLYQRSATNQADPLNPKRLLYREGMSKFEYSSVAELPLALPQPWSVPRVGIPAGEIESHVITSALQKIDRPLFVYVPPGYRPGGQAQNLLVLFDAGGYVEGGPIPAATILDNLIAEGRIPSTIAVMVGNVGERRTQDLSPNPQFSGFVTNELLPWIRRRYTVTDEPSRTVIGGASLGGLAAASIALRHPHLFGKVLAQSGSFWWAPDHNNDVSPLDATTDTNWMAKQFIASPLLPLQFHLDAGTFETDITGSASGLLESTRHLRDVLRAKGYNVHYEQFTGGHDYLGWRGTLATGLIALLGGDSPRR